MEIHWQTLVVFLIFSRWLVQIWLELLNQRNVRMHSDAVPEAFRGVMDDATYARSVRYTLAKGRFNLLADTVQLLWLLPVLFSGVLPWIHHGWLRLFGASAGSMAASRPDINRGHRLDWEQLPVQVDLPLSFQHDVNLGHAPVIMRAGIHLNIDQMNAGRVVGRTGKGPPRETARAGRGRLIRELGNHVVGHKIKPRRNAARRKRLKTVARGFKPLPAPAPGLLEPAPI